jgi:hypothetical protein
MVAGVANAAPQFTLDPTALPGVTPVVSGNPNLNGTNSPFIADFVQGASTELLTLNSTGLTGDGLATFSGFTLNGNPVKKTGIGTFWNLYITYSLSATLTSGVNGAPGANYNVTSLNFTVFADPNADDAFSNASSAGAGTKPGVTNTSDDIALASGSLVSGTAGFDSQGGAFLNSTEAFAVCTGAGTADFGGIPIADPACTDGTGSKFFKAPVPFYNLAFDEFNNTSQGVSANLPLVAISQASGGVDFNSVPEPGTLTLLGGSFAFAGFALRRRRQAA